MADEKENEIPRGGGGRNTGPFTEIYSSTAGNHYHQATHSSGTGQLIDNAGNVNIFGVANNSEAILGDKFKDVRGSDNESIAGPKTIVAKGDVNLRVGSLNAAAANADALIKQGIHDKKQLFEIQRTEYPSIYNSKDQKKSGAPQLCPECSQDKKFPAVNSYVEKELNKIVATPLNALLESVSNLLGGKIEFPDIKIKFPGLELIQFPPTAKCKVCEGLGESGWSYGGEWASEPAKEEIQKLYEDAGPSIAAAEEGLGDGGNYLVEVTRNMMINVGMATNKMSDIRIDDKGKQSPYGMTVGEQRTYQKQVETPLVEKVHVDNLAGGTFTLFAGNGANFIVGARGLCFDCYGTTKINGSKVDIGGAQVNISSKNEVNLASDSRLALEAKVLSLKSTSGQVLMENNLGVSGNMIVGGGAHIEGETFLNHVTAPMELQLTEMTPYLFGQSNPKDEKKIGFLKVGTKIKCKLTGFGVTGSVSGGGGGTINLPVSLPVGALSGELEVLEVSPAIVSAVLEGAPVEEPDLCGSIIYPHNHVFRSIPMTLEGSNEDVRKKAAAVESKEPLAPSEAKFEIQKGPASTRGKNYVDLNMWKKNAEGGEGVEPYFVNMSPGNEVTVNSTGDPTKQQSTPYMTPRELSQTIPV
jgi:hypothetical protein